MVTNQVRPLRRLTGKEPVWALRWLFSFFDASPPSLALVSSTTDSESLLLPSIGMWPEEIRSITYSCLWCSYLNRWVTQQQRSQLIDNWLSRQKILIVSTPYVPRYPDLNHPTTRLATISIVKVAWCVTWIESSDHIIHITMPRELTSKTQLWFLSWLGLPYS